MKNWEGIDLNILTGIWHQQKKPGEEENPILIVTWYFCSFSDQHSLESYSTVLVSNMDLHSFI